MSEARPSRAAQSADHTTTVVAEVVVACAARQRVAVTRWSHSRPGRHGVRAMLRTRAQWHLHARCLRRLNVAAALHGSQRVHLHSAYAHAPIVDAEAYYRAPSVDAEVVAVDGCEGRSPLCHWRTHMASGSANSDRQ